DAAFGGLEPPVARLVANLGFAGAILHGAPLPLGANQRHRAVAQPAHVVAGAAAQRPRVGLVEVLLGTEAIDGLRHLDEGAAAGLAARLTMDRVQGAARRKEGAARFGEVLAKGGVELREPALDGVGARARDDRGHVAAVDT